MEFYEIPRAEFISNIWNVILCDDLNILQQEFMASILDLIHRFRFRKWRIQSFCNDSYIPFLWNACNSSFKKNGKSIVCLTFMTCKLASNQILHRYIADVVQNCVSASLERFSCNANEVITMNRMSSSSSIKCARMLRTVIQK